MSKGQGSGGGALNQGIRIQRQLPRGCNGHRSGVQYPSKAEPKGSAALLKRLRYRTSLGQGCTREASSNNRATLAEGLISNLREISGISARRWSFFFSTGIARERAAYRRQDKVPNGAERGSVSFVPGNRPIENFTPPNPHFHRFGSFSVQTGTCSEVY